MTIYSQISGNKVKTLTLFIFFILFITGFFALIGYYQNDVSLYVVMGLLVSLFSSFISYFFADSIILSTVQAIPANKKQFFHLYTVTENLNMVSGMPMPKLYVIQDNAPNAFATGRSPKHAIVCVTTGLLQILDRTELEGVIAHELSHIKNYDVLVMTVVSVLVGTIALVSDWILRSFWWRSRESEENNSNRNPIVFIFVILALILSPLIATIIQLTISKRREYLADASGALITRYPEGLARALEKIAQYTQPMKTATTSTAHLFIANPFSKRKSVQNWIMNLFSTHPPVEERIKLLREM